MRPNSDIFPPSRLRHRLYGIRNANAFKEENDVYAVPMYNGNIKGIGRKGNNVHATVVLGGPLGENDGGAA